MGDLPANKGIKKAAYDSPQRRSYAPASFAIWPTIGILCWSTGIQANLRPAL
jgi:hypothetical protein